MPGAGPRLDSYPDMRMLAFQFNSKWVSFYYFAHADFSSILKMA
ncbi:hypothetical protein TRIP_C20702 [Candidatus Zixiibacteriota bacterium]|nr:hypothetical protein TRIP_C20702 [candidate division Zixibacteria bacterium]